MPYAAIILQDGADESNATQRLVQRCDPGVELLIVDTVDAAVALLRTRTDVAYVIVDLLLESSPTDKQGGALIEWLRADERLAQLPVLVLTAFESMIGVGGRIPANIPIAKRTNSVERVRKKLIPFIEAARKRLEL
jgi:hypothetical protein